MRKANPLILLLECTAPGRCLGHFVGVTYRGSLVFYGHDIADLKAEIAFARLGGVDPCLCAQHLERSLLGQRLRARPPASVVLSMFKRTVREARIRRRGIKKGHPDKNGQIKAMREWLFKDRVTPGPHVVSVTNIQRDHPRVMYYPRVPRDWPPGPPEDNYMRVRSVDLWDVLRKD